MGGDGDPARNGRGRLVGLCPLGCGASYEAGLRADARAGDIAKSGLNDASARSSMTAGTASADNPARDRHVAPSRFRTKLDDHRVIDFEP